MNTLYDIIRILPLSLLSVLLCGTYAGIPADSPSAFILCTVFTLFLIALRNMQNRHRLRSIGLVTVFLAALIFAAGKENRQLFIRTYFWVIWLACYAAAAVTAGILMQHSRWARRGVSAGFLIYCITGAVLEWKISKEAFALICFLLLIQTAEEIQRRWHKSGCPDLKEHLTRISPVFLAGCLLVYRMPAPSAPYDWQFAKDIYHAAETGLNRLYGYLTHTADDYGTMGFSAEGSFLAGIRENDETVLVITSDSVKTDRIRLVGSISSDFTGRAWQSDPESAVCARETDTLETVCAVRKFDDAARAEYLWKTDLHCESFLYNTRYLFSPAKIKLEETRQKRTDLTEQNGSILTENGLLYQDSYDVACYLLNDSHPKMTALLENAEPISETEWQEAARAEGVQNQAGYSFADYQQYRSAIYESCLRPADLPDAVSALLHEISSRAGSRYEAAKLLEGFLSSMEYDTNSGALPDTVTDAGSFLAYFLFDAKRGYCMHYATAFTLMANAMGIPCRYVQGYLAEPDADGVITVKQSHAHAWPEVYFDHAGWIAFEPTPGFAVSAGWNVVGTAQSGYGLNPYLYQPSGEQTEPDLPPAEPEEQEPFDPMLILLPASAVICFLLLCVTISRLAARGRYRRLNECGRLRRITQQNLLLLQWLGFRMEPDETLTDFRNRIMQSGNAEIKEQLGFLSAYETMLYSAGAVTGEEVRSAEQTHRALRALVRKGRMRYRLLLLFQSY